MTLSELVLLIHWEVQKSVNLIDGLAQSSSSDRAVNIHMGMDNFEVTIPITMQEAEIDYDVVNKDIADERFRKFYYPLIVQADSDIKSPTKRIAAKRKGKVLNVSVETSKEEKGGSGKTGMMKLTLRRTQV